MDVAASIRSAEFIPSFPLHGQDVHSNRVLHPFTTVHESLLSLGAKPIDVLAESSQGGIQDFDLWFPPSVLRDFSIAQSSSARTSSRAMASIGAETQGKILPPSSGTDMRQVAELYDVCSQTFGIFEALRFEFLEDHDPNKKQCILTITRPNGVTRSYTTQPEFSRKSDAKARVAVVAMDMGAIDFILHGDNDNADPHKLILAPLDGHLERKPEPSQTIKVKTEDCQDDYADQIEDCCLEWRAGDVKPRWIPLDDLKQANKFGCALSIQLSTHSWRVHSVGTVHDTMREAKQACAKLALDNGVLDFIKHGNGQKAPPTDTQVNVEEDLLSESPETKTSKGPMTLQAFYEALPKPFSEPVGEKTAAEINAQSWLNILVQLAKGSKLTTSFHWITDPKTGLHGCLLRLDRPSESRSFLADTLFPKRADARAAVCLQAMSEGVGNYIRELVTLIDGKVTLEMRKVVNSRILPALGSECARATYGIYPVYDYDFDQGAFGCTMAITLSPECGSEGVKTWTVPTEYRTKVDAKIAVLYNASWDAVNFLRFRGQSPSTSRLSQDREQTERTRKRKRKNGKDGDGDDVDSTIKEESDKSDLPRQAMRNTAISGAVKLGIPMLQIKQETMPRRRGPKAAKVPRPDPSRMHARPPFVPGSSSGAAASRLRDVSAAATAVIEQLEGKRAAVAYTLPPPPPLPPRIMHEYPPTSGPSSWQPGYNCHPHYSPSPPTLLPAPPSPSFAYDPYGPGGYYDHQSVIFPPPPPPPPIAGNYVAPGYPSAYHEIPPMYPPPPDWRPEYPAYAPQNVNYQRTAPHLPQDWRQSSAATTVNPSYTGSGNGMEYRGKRPRSQHNDVRQRKRLRTGSQMTMAPLTQKFPGRA